MLNVLLSTTILILLTFVLLKIFGGKMRARGRCIVWSIVAVRLMLPISLPYMDPMYEISVQVEPESKLPALFHGFSQQPADNGGATANVMPVTEKQSETKERSPSQGLIGFSENTAGEPLQQNSEKTEFQQSTEQQTVVTGEAEKTEKVGTETAAGLSNSIPVSKQVPAHQATVNISGKTDGQQISDLSRTAEDTRKLDGNDIFKICLTVWLTGTAVILIFHILSYVVQRKKIASRVYSVTDQRITEAYKRVCLQAGVAVPPPLMACAEIGSPMIMGYFRPVIYLPERVPETALDGILMHELVHLRRHDVWRKLAGTIIRAIYWFHPLVYAAMYRLDREVELACDEKVLASYDQHQRLAYAEGMLDILRDTRERLGQSASASRFNPSKNEVKERIMNIMDMSVKRRGSAVIALVLILSLTAGSLVSCNVFEEPRKQNPNTTEGDDAQTIPFIETIALAQKESKGLFRENWSCVIRDDTYQILDETTVEGVRHFAYRPNDGSDAEAPVCLGFERDGVLMGYNPYDTKDYSSIYYNYDKIVCEYVPGSLEVEEIAGNAGFVIRWSLSDLDMVTEYSRAFLWYGIDLCALTPLGESYIEDIDGDGILECMGIKGSVYYIFRFEEEGIRCYELSADLQSEAYVYSSCEWIRDNLFICYGNAPEPSENHGPRKNEIVGCVVRYRAGTAEKSAEYSYTECRLLASSPEEAERLVLPEVDTKTLEPTEIRTFGTYTVLSVGDMNYICDVEGKALYATEQTLKSYAYGPNDRYFQTDSEIFFIEKNPADGEYYRVNQRIGGVLEEEPETSEKEVAREVFFNPETPYLKYRFYQNLLLHDTIPQGRCELYEDWNTPNDVQFLTEQPSVEANAVRIATQEQIESLQSMIDSQYKNSTEVVPESLLATGKYALVTWWGEYLLPPEYDSISNVDVRTDCADGAVYFRVQRDGVYQIAVYDPVNALCEVLPETYRFAGIPKEIRDSVGDVCYVTWVYDGETCYPVKHKSEKAENQNRDEIKQAQQAAYEAAQLMEAEENEKQSERLWVPTDADERIYLDPLAVDIAAIKPVSMDIFVLGNYFCSGDYTLSDANKWRDTLTLIYDGTDTYICTPDGQVIYQTAGKMINRVCMLMKEGDGENAFQILYDETLKQYYIAMHGGHGGGYGRCYYDTTSGTVYSMSVDEGGLHVTTLNENREYHGQVPLKQHRNAVQEITLPEGWTQSHFYKAYFNDGLSVEELFPDGGKFGVCDGEGNLIVPPEYHLIVGYRSGYTVAQKEKNGKYVYLTEDGSVFNGEEYVMAGGVSDINPATNTCFTWVYDGEQCHIQELPGSQTNG